MRSTRIATWVHWTLIAVLLLFGGITLFLSASVLLDLFGMREKEGNYVQFVVLANFFASILYFAAAIGRIARKAWARYPLWLASVVLLVASLAFGWHVYQDGIHEQRTIGALAFRTVLTIAFYTTAVWIGRASSTNENHHRTTMNHKLTFIAAALALFTFGCGEHNEHDGHTEGSSPATADHEHDDHEHADEVESASIPKVMLDNGQRWKANPETTTGIANMVTLIDKQIATAGDAKALKAALEEEFALIFERCTMTGEAHEQLHTYLIPLHQRFSGFDAGDAKQLSDMKSYLGTYGNYFE